MSQIDVLLKILFEKFPKSNDEIIFLTLFTKVCYNESNKIRGCKDEKISGAVDAMKLMAAFFAERKLSQNFSWAVWLNPTDCLSVSTDRRGS